MEPGGGSKHPAHGGADRQGGSECIDPNPNPKGCSQDGSECIGTRLSGVAQGGSVLPGAAQGGSVLGVWTGVCSRGVQ
jgi:hypothetical protein